MPQFIHLTDTRNIRMIRKSGIISTKIYGKKSGGVYATPVTSNYYLSHQWLRELKRRGIKAISAVQFKLDDNENVSIGRFNKEHIELTAAEAVQSFVTHETGLGLEIIIPRSISPKSISRIYFPNQVTGWRYYPEAHAAKHPPMWLPILSTRSN